MNNFTKSELQIIHIDMTIYANSSKLMKESPSHKALRDKVEAMIDSYCAHEKKVKAHEWSIKYTCMKCGELFNDNQ
jgi:hypothetical protein